MIDPEFRQLVPMGMPHERCQYPSKRCLNPRTLKRNGQLHRFCEEHRDKANQNQKRWCASRQRRWDVGNQTHQRPVALRPDQPLQDSTSVDAALPTVDATFTSEEIALWNEAALWDATAQWPDAGEFQEFLSDLLQALASDDTPEQPVEPTTEPSAEPFVASFLSFW